MTKEATHVKITKDAIKQALAAIATPMNHYANLQHAATLMAPTSNSAAYFTGNADKRMTGPVVADFSHLHGNQFWSQIQVTADDYVRFKLFRGGWIAKALYFLGKEPKDEDGKEQEWDSIGHQGTDAKLEVTLGRTYLKIDEIIADELGDHKHRKFIKEMVKTDPENLKMIASLKNLDEGMNGGSPEVPEHDVDSAERLAEQIRPGIIKKYEDIMNVKVSGTFTGNDLMKLNSGPSLEVIQIDTDGNVFKTEDYDTLKIRHEENMDAAKEIQNASGFGPECRDENGELIAENEGSAP